ncbi:MAG TPA: response regulator transcription factor [Selenomonadales bacterium]|nr:response regulator transcription factor [Selenomonadales bacterium]
MKVLVVDDDEKLVKVLKAYLLKEGYTVETAFDGLVAVDKVLRFQPDVLLLDLMLPGIDGWEVCKEIRRTSNVPIIMLTAAAGEDQRVSGLDLGADDYVTKPFSPREVLARIRAIIRRMKPTAAGEDRVLRVGNIKLNSVRHTVTVNDETVELTPTEYKLLELLMSHTGQAFTRLQLVERTQGNSYDGFERTIDSHIKNLRRKIGDDPNQPRYIRTIYGVGYKMAGDDHA